MSQKPKVTSFKFLDHPDDQLRLDTVPVEILETIPFHQAWEMKQQANQKIWTSRGECGANRPYSVFLQSPSKKSDDYTYMFSEDGSTPKFVPLPEIFEELYEYVCNTFNTKFNQVVMNWYEKHHYLAQHIDWDNGTLDGPIVCVTLLRGEPRRFSVRVPRDMDPLLSHARFVTKHGTMISLHGPGTKFHHGIEKLRSSADSKRVSITFRRYAD